MGEKREQPGPAEDVPDQRRKNDRPECVADPDLGRKKLRGDRRRVGIIVGGCNRWTFPMTKIHFLCARLPEFSTVIQSPAKGSF
jgi:hypothetical protein